MEANIMKKFLSLFLAVLLVGVLSGCNRSNKEDTDKSSQNSTSQTTTSSSTASSSTSEKQSETVLSTTIDDVRKVNPEKEVSVLRRELYEAGINSSEMSDAEIEEYAKEAEEKNLDFITYIEEEVLN